MITITKKQLRLMSDSGLEKNGKKLEKDFKCDDFVKSIYEEVGVNHRFSDHPILSVADISQKKFEGHLFFLKHKKYIQELYRFSHVGIILQNNYLLHYSRYFGKLNIRQVCITPLSEIFEVYNLAIPNLKFKSEL